MRRSAGVNFNDIDDYAKFFDNASFLDNVEP